MSVKPAMRWEILLRRGATSKPVSARACLRTSRALKIVQYILYGLVILGFLMHTGGLALRWYISGHAPWSNGYESMIYIAWATVLSGLFSQDLHKLHWRPQQFCLHLYLWWPI